MCVPVSTKRERVPERIAVGVEVVKEGAELLEPVHLKRGATTNVASVLLEVRRRVGSTRPVFVPWGMVQTAGGSAGQVGMGVRES